MAKKTKTQSKLKDGEFNYGDVEMTDEEYQEAQNPKVRTTIFLEEDLISAYKQKALKHGLKYQQLLRDTLRQALSAPSDIETRLEALEQKVFKKRA
jgi:predicted DNA binding CopG/RHH family protein